MIQITPHMRIYLCIAPIDFRKGIDGLSRVCRDILDKEAVGSGMLFYYLASDAVDSDGIR